MTVNEPAFVRLSEKTHGRLKRLKEDGHFQEMLDGYRCGIALALAQGVIPDELPTPRQNVFGVALIDPHSEIATAIRAIMDTKDIPVYRWAERLAEWGIEELARQAESGQIDFGRLINQVQQLRTPTD
jgi:hypothetical protein